MANTENPVMTKSEALEASIKHWEENRKLAEDSLGEYKTIPIKSNSCALCDLYICADCYGCPVKARTGKSGCKESPWEDVNRLSYGSWITKNYVSSINNMVLFLKSLREDVANEPVKTCSTCRYLDTDVCTYYRAPKTVTVNSKACSYHKARLPDREEKLLGAINDAFTTDCSRVTPVSLTRAASHVESFHLNGTAQMLKNIAAIMEEHNGQD